LKVKTNKKTEQMNETGCFFETIHKIDKPLARLTKKKRERTQINKITKEERSQPTLNKYK